MDTQESRVTPTSSADIAISASGISKRFGGALAVAQDDFYKDYGDQGFFPIMVMYDGTPAGAIHSTQRKKGCRGCDGSAQAGWPKLQVVATDL